MREETRHINLLSEVYVHDVHTLNTPRSQYTSFLRISISSLSFLSLADRACCWNVSNIFLSFLQSPYVHYVIPCSYTKSMLHMYKYIYSIWVNSIIPTCTSQLLLELLNLILLVLLKPSHFLFLLSLKLCNFFLQMGETLLIKRR